MKRTILTVSATLACASAPFALQAASAEQNKPVEQLDQLAFPVGDWTCSGSIAAMDKKPGHATTGHARTARILEGNWVEIRYDEEQTAANPKPYHVAQYIGYDEAKKHYTSVTLDSSGASYEVGASTGWNGNALAVDATVSMDGKDVAYRDVFTKKGADEFSHAGMLKDKSGKWAKTDEETCHKA